MTAEFREETAVDDAEPAKHPCEQRYFECHAHDQQHRHEIVDIRVECDGIGNVGRKLVGGQKMERKGENKEIGRGHTHIKEHVAENEGRGGMAFLAGIKPGRHKRPQFIYKERECHYKSQLERQRQVDKELRRELGVDQRHMEVGRAARAVAGERRQGVKQAV